jgi:hypothetical protein
MLDNKSATYFDNFFLKYLYVEHDNSTVKLEGVSWK